MKIKFQQELNKKIKLQNWPANTPLPDYWCVVCFGNIGFAVPIEVAGFMDDFNWTEGEYDLTVNLEDESKAKGGLVAVRWNKKDEGFKFWALYCHTYIESKVDLR